MLMIYVAIFTLFLASRISSLPAPSTLYSAVIYNARKTPIQCVTFWNSYSVPNFKIGPFTIQRNGYKVLSEVEFNFGSWRGAGIIKKIQCGKLILTAPFQNVRTATRNWEFRVQPNKIVSVGPSSYKTDKC
ncbi:unnamed protein product [Rotaria sp. Silwood1]|nr:unnamed protein product [Rotaria sp. Silwood1]